MHGSPVVFLPHPYKLLVTVFTDIRNPLLTPNLPLLTPGQNETKLDRQTQVEAIRAAISEPPAAPPGPVITEFMAKNDK